MGRLEGRVALITGAARGQGRSHAIRLAEEAADIVAIDVDGGVETAPYPIATAEDLAHTAELVEKQGRRIVARRVDVREQGLLDETVREASAELGPIDIAVANAGISQKPGKVWEIPELVWQEMMDINLTGVWHTVKAVIPAMIAAGEGGSITLISSAAGLKGTPNTAAYVSAKHALVGLMRTLAIELAPHRIRVNSVHPSTVETDMILNDRTYRLFRPDLENPTLEDTIDRFRGINLLPIPWLDPVDISNALVWLASDEARYVTGVALPVDAGFYIK
jgi:SDR family mycofactocin-dependent oxidoreductase